MIDAIIVPSDTSARVLRDQGFVKNGKTEIKVIFHGITKQLTSFEFDEQLIADLGLWKEPQLIFCPCRADEHKDIDAFLDAAGILKKNNEERSLLFVIATDASDPFYQYAVNRARINGLTEEECIFQKFSYKQMSTIYRHAHVCVVPSKHESFGQVVLEAFLMGVPVVAANISALTEIVVHCETGLHFTSGKSQELACHIERLLEDSELRERLIRNGRNLVETEERFSLETMRKSHEALYAKFFGKRGSVQPGKKKGR